MRFTSLILMVIVFFQIALPCCMANNHCGEEKSELTENPEKKKDCDHSCTGLCCGISFMLESATLNLIAIKSTFDTFTFDYTFDYHFVYSNSTWHPPLLS